LHKHPNLASGLAMYRILPSCPVYKTLLLRITPPTRYIRKSRETARILPPHHSFTKSKRKKRKNQTTTP